MVHSTDRGRVAVRARCTFYKKEPILQAFQAFQKRSSRSRAVHFTGLSGASVREWCTFCQGFFEPFRNGAPVREWCTSREFAGLPCESGALQGSSRDFAGLPCERSAHFVRGVFRAFSKRSSRARVVHFAAVHRAPVREWCTFCQGMFSSLFETELPCESGTLFVKGGFRVFETEIQCENGALHGS